MFFGMCQVAAPSTSEMSDRDRYRSPPQPEPPPHRVRASDLYPRERTHFDEPDLEIGFTPICAEFVKWVGRTTDGGSIAMSNYRLHLQPRRRSGPGASVPLRLIDATEIRDLIHLIVLCKNGRTFKCTFNTGDHCLEWWRRINTGLVTMSSVQDTFAAAYAAWAKEQPSTSIHRALLRAAHNLQEPWWRIEAERLGFNESRVWRISMANVEYKLCPSYPPALIVPRSIGDEDLDSVARFRAMRRIPTVVWRHRGNGAVIARSSQPEVGWLGWRSSEDERLLAAFVTACSEDRTTLTAGNNTQQKLLIVDARSYASAVTNRARGGGCECQQYYPAADIQFMCLPNIHHVRRSFQQMRALVAEPSDQANWHSNLERTLWLQYVAGVVRAAGVVARAVAAGRPALVHCSDGWDRTPQIVAAAQLMLDPYYRTIEGFRILIEREWLDFGHKFADRCGHLFGSEDPNERSPIFLQWLDAVHQLMLQYPCSFEFNEAYLIKLATHVHSCMFGTFLFNTSRERNAAGLADLTPCVWHLLAAPAYRNHLYSPHYVEQVIWPDSTVRSLYLWWTMYGGERDECVDDPETGSLEPLQPLEPLAATDTNPHAAATHHKQRTSHAGMAKTRSCDNLLAEGEKRTTQRRSSDPNIAPDVAKLSCGGMVAGESESRRGALTDSCVDKLAVLPVAVEEQHQVGALHPDHFENAQRLPRDIASGSSSLERELGGAAESADRDVVGPGAGAAGTNEDVERGLDVQDGPCRIRHTPDVETPEEQAVFFCDTYTDVIGMADAARESGRTRHISITWRSISESSNQSNPSSSGFDIEPRRSPDVQSSDDLPNSTERHRHRPGPGPGPGLGHVVVNGAVSQNGTNGHVNGTNSHLNGLDEVTGKFLEVDFNGGATSSSISSESEGEAAGGACRVGVGPAARRGAAARGRAASQLTLCPASPRRAPCCHCSRRASTTSGVETSGESAASSERRRGACAAARCVCGGGAAAAARDALDGLPPATDPLQARLHHIILHQKKVVEELSGQLREAREALRLASPVAAPPPLAASPTQMPSSGSVSGSVSVRGSGSGSGSSSGSASGSASEVEVGEEARGVVWLPDSAAPRCQYCSNHFWLARRRHHCRRCGGIFCGSCSEMSSWGDCGSVRVCRRCRALR
ncbi:myotubularin-related protein 3 isoform X3 [Galleria mellonella]|uniref:phosphatidylinositol-3,5-bisphosphate 3-phosphatase n=1 Tax=Galleria mellonella TaxID=7137 RepID=A0ABM3MKV0_GALME|nr:myotubularin-related protein 3 isoform X3 [Galleria mellonella]